MQSKRYDSPLGPLRIVISDQELVALWLEEKIRYKPVLAEETSSPKSSEPLFHQVAIWLDGYFAGEKPDPNVLPLGPKGSDFQQAVWAELLKIPYGEVVTYGAIAKTLAKARGIERMSSQAVGGAVGRNPISIIIPCHRVVGSDGSLTGYGGGIENKVKLLEGEGVDMTKLYVPKKGTAL